MSLPKILNEPRLISVDDVNNYLKLGEVSGYEAFSIKTIICSVEEEMLKYIGYEYEEFMEKYKDGIPANIVNAMLVRITTRYENRGETTQKNINAISANCWENVLLRYVKPEEI